MVRMLETKETFLTCYAIFTVFDNNMNKTCCVHAIKCLQDILIFQQ